MDYLTVKETAEKWGISDRRVRILCSEGKIPYVIRKGRSYQIPEDAVKPVDGRSYRYKTIPDRFSEQFLHIDSLKEEISRYRPLTQGELERLREEFLIEYTYNSNAIEGNTLTLQETALVLEGVTIDKKPLKDHLEAVGHKDAFLFVEKLARDLSPLTEHDIKQIHTLYWQTARKTADSIGVSLSVFQGLIINRLNLSRFPGLSKSFYRSFQIIKCIRLNAPLFFI